MKSTLVGLVALIFLASLPLGQLLAQNPDAHKICAKFYNSIENEQGGIKDGTSELAQDIAYSKYSKCMGDHGHAGYEDGIIVTLTPVPIPSELPPIDPAPGVSPIINVPDPGNNIVARRLGESGRDAVFYAPSQPSQVAVRRASAHYHFDSHVTVSGPANTQSLTIAGIGNMAVVGYGVVSAVDVWGNVPYNTLVCFIGRGGGGGGVIFLDAATNPRALSWLPHFIIGSDTCVDIPGAGAVVLVRHAGPYAPLPDPNASASSAVPLTDCQLLTRDVVNLRASEWGDVVDTIPFETTLTATESSQEFFKVSFDGTSGWVHRDWVTITQGDC